MASSLSDFSERPQQEDPAGDGDAREQRRDDDDPRGENVVVLHVLCHNIRARRRGQAEHREQGDKLVAVKAEDNGQREEHAGQGDQLDEGGKERRPPPRERLPELHARADRDKGDRGGHIGEIAERLVNERRETPAGNRKEQPGENSEENRVFAHAEQRLFELGRMEAAAVAVDGENQHGEDVEQRHRSGVFQYEETEDINAGIPFDGIELNEAAEALTPKQRETLILHRVHGFTFAEIAARRGCSKQAVSRQEKHALDKLRAVL